MGCSELENWVPQSTPHYFSAVFLQVSTQLQFLCKIRVKYGCWPCLHTSYLMFIETGGHCYPLICIEKDQTAHSDFPCTVGVCVDMYFMEKGLSFPWVSGQASAGESVSIARFHISKHSQHRPGRDKTRWVSPLKMLSESKWSQWNALLVPFVSERRFQWIFREILINPDTEYSGSEVLWV